MAAIGFKAAQDQVAKSQPGAGDVHVAGAGGDDPLKAKRRKARLYAQIAAANMGAAVTGKMQKFAKVEAINKKLGMVFGFGIVCKEDGVDYFDLQDDHIPEDAMLKAAADFSDGARMHREMHDGESGQWLFIFPMTGDIAKAFGITTRKTGLMLGFKPSADVLAKFEDGTYTGFSIGGLRITDEEVD